MWKVSFKDPSSKKIKRFNNRATVVTLKGDMQIPMFQRSNCPFLLDSSNIKLIIGKYGSTRPDYNQKDTLHSIHGKYSALWGKELKHLEELFDLVKSNG